MFEKDFLFIDDCDRTENRPANPVVKPTAPRTNPTEPSGDKKSTKAPPPTTTTVTPKSSTQKSNNTTKPTVTAPVKPMPNKKSLSPLDLSDEDCKFFHFFLTINFIVLASPETEPTPVASVPSQPPPARRPSDRTLG